MYTKILPIFEEFQRENNIKNIFKNTAKCYGVFEQKGKEAVVLHNLKSLGFDIYCRTQPQNLNHVLFVFRNYGRWHALSLAMKIKKPSVFNAMTKNLSDVLGKFIIQANLLQQAETNFADALTVLEKHKNFNLVKKFDNIKNNLKEILTNMGNGSNPCAVILHGDCWNNNFMFKYEVK